MTSFAPSVMAPHLDRLDHGSLPDHGLPIRLPDNFREIKSERREDILPPQEEIKAERREDVLPPQDEIKSERREDILPLQDEIKSERREDILPLQDEGERPPPSQEESNGRLSSSQSGLSTFKSSTIPNGVNHAPSIKLQGSQAVAKALGNRLGEDDGLFDMICVGFGPASLAIAIALADKYASLPGSSHVLPKVLFLERQAHFAWHSGMQLPEAKMQISFLKDLATPRDPTSPFSFTNYLHSHGRLNNFINLGTFLPSRMEYEDYMRWCASHFERAVMYDREATKVEHAKVKSFSGKIDGFKVSWRSAATGLDPGFAHARHVVIATGGRPSIPSSLGDLIIPEAAPTKTGDTFPYGGHGSWHIAEHSSRYAITIKQIESHFSKHPNSPPPRFVVVGGGQSSAEIFSDLWSRFPNAYVTLVIKAASLRPSDDSPFVNEIFDPERVDGIYQQDPTERATALKLDRGTNYGVVRLELLEHLYEKLYMQRIREPDATKWRCRIIPNRAVVGMSMDAETMTGKIVIEPTVGTKAAEASELREELPCTQVFAATGYLRNAHEELLRDTVDLLPAGHDGKKFPVGRDYRVKYDGGKVEEDAGVWLQGCNESTHGLSDTLLSILAIRGGEMVNSIFGTGLEKLQHSS